MNKNELIGAYAIAKIDGVEYGLQIFFEGNKLMTTNLNLIGGTHTLTSYKLYKSDGTLLAEDNNELTFDVDVSFTIELPVNLTFQDNAAYMMMAMSITGLDYGITYVKSNELPITESENEIVQMIGILGILENDKNLYEQHDIYKQRDITSKVKAKFAIQHWYNGVLVGTFFSDWNAQNGLELSYIKSGNHQDINKFKIQVERVTNSGGVRAIRDVIDGSEIIIHGDESLQNNEKGIVEFSVFPQGWLSNSVYQFNFTP